MSDFALNSMTGFARTAGETPDGEAWSWEVRSVNAKGLDVRLRLPHGFEALETAARKAVSEVLSRGNISATLTVLHGSARDAYRLNDALLEHLAGRARTLGQDAPRIDVLMTAKGVIEQAEPDPADSEARNAALLAGFSEALSMLAAMRRSEGAGLAPVIAELTASMDGMVSQARNLAAAQPEAIKARLTEQIAELVGETAQVPEDRLAHEVALLATKADVREELDRLSAHLQQARELMTAGKPCGRRLDFLSQELNREANTLCSKSQDLTLTRLGLDLKAAIEQWREQIQNIE